MKYPNILLAMVPFWLSTSMAGKPIPTKCVCSDKGIISSTCPVLLLVACAPEASPPVQKAPENLWVPAQP